MNKRILTIEDLIAFFKKNKIYTFNSKENGSPIIVQTIQDFSSAEIEETADGLLFAKVKVCHILLNRNGSYINEENMLKAMPTLKYKPLLANIHQLDNGTWDFHSHDMHEEKDENGNDILVYDENQIGTFTVDDPYLEYDEEMDKTYVIAKVAIPEEYTKAADIIREKRGTKVSCELAIYDCSYNAKEKYLELTDFIFNGCTCLGSEKDGTPIGEGMLGSKLTLEDFNESNNSIVKFSNQISKMQEKLDTLLSRCFNNELKGGENLNKIKELLKQYNKTMEDITFDYENLSDENLEMKFKEEFGTDDNTSDGGGENAEVPKNNTSTNEENFDKLTKTYEISHEDIRYALYNLLAPYEEADNEWYFITGVYDTYFAYENWNGGSIYGQTYSKSNDNVSFEGERYALHRELLTDSEYAELQSMRSNYASLVEFKNNAEKNELHTQRENILSDEKYSSLTDNSHFKELIKNMDNYSLEELEKEAKVILADHITNNGTFTYSGKGKIPFKPTGILKSKNKKNRYGSIFSEN